MKNLHKYDCFIDKLKNLIIYSIIELKKNNQDVLDEKIYHLI